MRLRPLAVLSVAALTLGSCAATGAADTAGPASDSNTTTSTPRAAVVNGSQLPVLSDPDSGAEQVELPGVAQAAPSTAAPSAPTSTPLPAPTTSAAPSSTTAAPLITVVIDDRAPTAAPDDEDAEDGVIRNGDGNVVTLDQAAALACAAAEGVLTALDEGSDPSDEVSEMKSWTDQTNRPAIVAAVDAMSEPVTFDALLPVLEACIAEGYEL